MKDFNKKFGFPKTVRLRNKREFTRVMRGGVQSRTRHFLIYASDETNKPACLGMAVSKKVGNAVFRNRIKRTLRQAFRLGQTEFFGCDFVVVAKVSGEVSSLRTEIGHEEILSGLRLAKSHRGQRRRSLSPESSRTPSFQKPKKKRPEARPKKEAGEV